MGISSKDAESAPAEDSDVIAPSSEKTESAE